MDDKRRETVRYNCVSDAVLRARNWGALPSGKDTVPGYLREPYEKFETEINIGLSYFGPNPNVLELCAGTGNFTAIPVNSGAIVTATDIAVSALEVVRARYCESENLSVAVADIERTGFASESFDMVMCAGGLSYGDNQLVLKEIVRLLKPGGVFVCVDSLNHNLFYRLNRFIHYVRGQRTASTLRRMPTVELINSYSDRFSSFGIWYFGCASWAMPIVSRVVGVANATSFSRWVDRLFDVKYSAFKFVMTGRKTN